jgi:riboflavin kinase/FMN adenylyltransferase
VETHILDFSGELLGKTIKVHFIKRLRDEKTFKSLEDLSHQIARDIAQAKEVFRET